MKTTRISQVLTRLMSEKQIRVTELARRVGLPQPTVQRIAMGTCEHPHASSLLPIAEYFSITVDQLKGLDPIPVLDNESKIPHLTWEQVSEWPANQPSFTPVSATFTDANIGARGYAVTLKDASMDPVFPKNTVLIADPDRAVKDRSYIIAKLHEHDEPIFRQLIIDAKNYYLKGLSPDFNQYKMPKLNNNDKILSVVIQAKRDCVEE